LSEYRLDELATLSGVSARNIRAYRERGLLDPPRRAGRSALYGDQHLSQLRTIKELLRRGFTSAHIAEFFAGMRQGQDLADILGLQQAIFGPPRQGAAVSAHIDPTGDEARRLVAHSLAENVDGGVAWVDPRVAEIVAKAIDPRDYVRAILRVSDGIAESLDDIAGAVVKSWEDSVIARFGPDYVPRSQDVAALRQRLTDYRVLGGHVVADKLDKALQRHLVDTVAKYTADAVLSARWEPADT
jgi:DNA-binding transcriptional MerR regulator